MRKLRMAAFGLVIILALAQLVQPERTNPPSDPAAAFEAIVKPPQQAATVIARSCHNCHSNQTVWPWYSSVAPVSWLVARDVHQGRAQLNFSQWNIYGPEMSRIRIKSICDEVKEGNMPPKYYTPLHRNARLTADDVGALCALTGS